MLLLSMGLYINPNQDIYNNAFTDKNLGELAETISLLRLKSKSLELRIFAASIIMSLIDSMNDYINLPEEKQIEKMLEKCGDEAQLYQ